MTTSTSKQPSETHSLPSNYLWADKLAGFNPDELMPTFTGDGWDISSGTAKHIKANIAYNINTRRIEIFLHEGGWIGLNEDGTWEFDLAPFAG